MTTIAKLNDQFRRGDKTLGRYVITPGVQALVPDELDLLIKLVQAFDQFTSGDDPHGEHNFGKVSLGGKDYFWKIDYYDPTFSYRSSDPASPNATRRVLTLMGADEY